MKANNIFSKITNKKVAIGVLVGFCIVLAAWYFYTPSARYILGPSNGPDFANMEWEHMEISYWVRTDPNSGFGTERTFELADLETINALKNKLHINEVGPDSLAGRGQLKIKMSNGDFWLVDVVFENRIDFCLEKDKYYSYVTETSDIAFYKALRKLCLKNEQKRNPHATIKHIKIRSNTGIGRYPLLEDKADM